MPFIEQDNYTAPQVPIVIKSEQQLDEEKRRHDKWFKGDAPTASEALARIYRISQKNPDLGKSLYESFSTFKQDKASPFFDPYSAPTNKTVFAELSKLGIDTSNVNDDWFAANKPLMDNVVLGVDGTPTKGKTKESKAAYYYYKASLDEPNTKAVEGEWETAKQEINYWANRTDLNLSDEEILKKLDIPNKYKGLSAIDESRQTGSIYELNRPIGYNQDGLLGAVWAARNKSTGNSETDAVQYRLGRGNSYKPDPVVRERLSPTSPKFNPYLVGSTMDDVTAFFGVQSIDEKWLNENTGAIMGGDDETAKAYLKKAWEANDFTEAADKEAAVLVASENEKYKSSGKTKYAVSRAIFDLMNPKTKNVEGLTIDEALEQYLNENYKSLGKIAASLRYKSPEDTTRAIGFDYYGLKDYVLSQAPMREMERKLKDAYGTKGPLARLDVDERLLDKASEMIKADVVAQNGDAVEGTVPETRVDSGLTWYGQLFKNVSTWLMGSDGAGGGGNAPDAGGGRPSFEQTEDDTEIYSATEGQGGKFGTSFEEIEDNTETYGNHGQGGKFEEKAVTSTDSSNPGDWAMDTTQDKEFNAREDAQSEDWIDAKRARLDELNAKLQDPAFRNVSPMNTDAYREYTNAKAEVESLTNEIKQYDESVATFGNELKRAAELQRFNEYDVPKGYVSDNDTPINRNKKAQDEGTDYLVTLSEDERKIPANILRGTGGLPFDLTLSEMTPDEKERYNWIHDNVSKAEADKYIEALTPDLNIRHRERMNKTATEMSAQVPVIATAALMTAQIPQAVIGAFSAVNAIFGTELKANDPFLDVVSVPAAIQQDLTKNMSEAGKFAFNAAIAVGQQGVRFALGGTPGSFVMAGSVFAGTTDDVLGRNGSQGEAFLLAGISASFEFILNKADFGRFIKLKNAFKPGAKDIIKGVIVGALIKNGGTEFLEEGFQYVIDGVADMYLLKEKSAWWQKFEYYKAENGGDEVKAWNSAAADIGKELGSEALMGYITGAFLGNVAVVVNRYNGKQNAKAMTETVKTADTQEGAITLVAQGVKANLDEKTAKVYEAQALDTLGIDTAVVDSIKQPLGLKKSQGLFDILRKLTDPKTKAERVFGSLIKTADPVGIAKLNLLANALGMENVQADNLVNNNLLKATNALANAKAEQLQTELDKMPAQAPAEGAQSDAEPDFTHTLQRWGAKGLIYINNLIQNGQKEIAVKLQSLPSFSKAVILAEAQMESLSMDKEAVKAQVSDTPDVIQNGEIRAEEQAVEVQVNEAMSTQDFTAQDTAIADAQERLAQVQQEREASEQAEADAVVQTEQLVEQANQNPADEQAIALAVSALDDLEKLRKDTVKARKAEETAKYEANKAKTARFEAEDKVRSEAEVQVRGELLKAKQAIAERQAKVQEQKQAEADKQIPVEQAEETPEAIADAIIQEQFPDATPEDRQKIIDRINGVVESKAPVFESKDFVKKAEAKFGVKFVADANVKGAEEGYYNPSDNSIHLNPNATQGDALVGVAMHELTHSAQTSGWYKGLSDTVLDILYKGNEAQQERDIQAKIDRYARDGKTLSPEQALEEIVAQGIRNKVFTDADSINRLLDTDISLAQKILETLNRIIASIKDAFGGTNTADLLKARDLLEKALTDRGEGAGKQYSLAEPMYSKMAQEIEAYKGEKIGVDSLIPYLRGRGVKADEIKWSGIETFLQGKKSVTKAELVEFAQGSQLNVRTIDYSAKPTVVRSDDGEFFELLDTEGNRAAEATKEENGEWWISGNFGEETIGEATEEEVIAYLQDLPENDYGNMDKFKTYSLPNGTNYREILFTLPDLDGSFQSAHWDEKNVLAHARLQDFETDMAEPVLFVEEVQSDWHERGREKGYITPEQIKTQEEYEKNKTLSRSDAIQPLMDERRQLVNQGAGVEAISAVDDKIAQFNDNWNARMTATRPDKQDLVSPAPFTDTWHESVMKRVLRMAAEGDYSYVAWTTGKMQADRYSLAKVIDQIFTTRYKNGSYYVFASKDGQKVDVQHTTVYESKADVINMFGKDLGQTIISEADGTVDEELADFEVDATFGGEGMKAFYDIGGRSSQNIPRFLSKYGAQWGAKVQEIKMGKHTVPAIDVTEAMRDSVLNQGQPMYSLSDDEIDAAIARYGAMKRGETPANERQIPKQVSDNQKVSQFARTESESGVFNTEQDKAFRDDVVNGRYSYDPVSDQSVLDKAEDVFKRNGIDGLSQAWTDAVGNDRIPNKAQVAIGERLLQESAKSGNVENTMKVSAELAEVLTRAGQTVQAARLLKKMTNAGQLYYLQRAINKLNADIKGDPIVLNPDLVQGLMNAKTEQERNDAVDKLSKDAGKQIPPTWKSRFTAWRYFAMLGNPRTHIRNIIGNMAFMPAIKMKNVLGAVIEKVARTKERTKSIVLNRDLLVDARADAEENKGILTWGGKYNPSDTITENAPSFGKSLVGKGMQGLVNANMNALEFEDWVFLRRHYANALAGYLQANKLTFETADEKTMTKARQYAVDEAKKATYRDASAFATWLNQASKKGGITGIIVEGVLPFKKTPANIIKRGIEYSPIGLLDTLTRGTKQLIRGENVRNGIAQLKEELKNNKGAKNKENRDKIRAKIQQLASQKGTITPTQFIDKLSSGLTGTMIAGLGAFLGSIGAIKIGFKDDKEDEFKRLTGSQEFAIEAFGYSVTLDWLVPSAMPLFVGATVQEMMTEEGISFENSLTALSQIMEPVFNLSMLEGVNRAIEAASWGETNAITEIMINSGTNLAGQFVPTLFGQVARTIDPVRRKVYADKNSPLPNSIQRMLNTAANKIPWLNQNSEPYLDVWGREDRTDSPWLRAFENFLSPAYINELTPDAVTEMLQEVYKQTGDPSVLPGTASKYFSVNGERIDLNGKEYTQFSKTRGETMYATMKSLLNNDAFQSMETRLKAKTLAKAIDYANQLGKKDINPEYPIDTFVKNGLKSDNPAEVILEAVLGGENDAKRTSYKQEAVKAITLGDYDSLEATYGALYEWYENEYPDDSEKQLTSKVRTYLNDKTKEAYLTAYADGDDDTMEIIEDTLSWVDIEYDYDDWKDKAD